jgi:membrane protein YqaA with SNARE-associated domain
LNWDLAQLGFLGIFLAGATPWVEAIAVVPSGILLGLDPVGTVIAATTGNALTIFAFAYLGSNIQQLVTRRRLAKGKSPRSKKYEKAIKAFDKYGIYGMALLGPIIIGTQFAAAASVAAGVKPFRTSLLITIAMAAWSVAFATALVAFDLSLEVL